MRCGNKRRYDAYRHRRMVVRRGIPPYLPEKRYPWLMSEFSALDLHAWLRSPLGRRVYALERKLASEALAQVFGWQLLQIGVWGDDDGLIADARTQRRSVLAWHGDRLGGQHSLIRSRTDALAIASDSVDAVVLPHTLEYEPDPHALLREVERILSAEGHLIVFGFRPLSSWALRHVFARDGFPPGLERMIGEGRLKDWLKLLGFEICDAQRYLFTLPWGSSARSSHFVERSGRRLWPLFAGGYVLKARKRVYAVTPIRPVWRRLRPKVVGSLIEPTTRQRDWHLGTGDWRQKL
jgi:SAM-dependent methyltransferase